MTDFRLYACTIPSGMRTRQSTDARYRQEATARIAQDLGSVEPVGSNPSEHPLTVEYPDPNAAIRIGELNELATGIGQPIPFYATGSTTSQEDGYYTLSQATTEPIDPRDDQFQRFRGSLSKAGTLASHWRAVTTRPTQLTTDFGNDTTVHVGVPASATKVRWFQPSTGKREGVTVQDTRTGEHGDVDILDASNSTYSEPELIYELEYDDEGLMDPRVWDDHGNSNQFDGQELQWQKVFASSHRFAGTAIVENSLIRLAFDEANNSLTAETWDTGSSSWTTHSLGTSDWELYDFDLRNAGLTVTIATVEFRNPTASPTEYYVLKMRLPRGYNSAQWFRPEGVSEVTPSGLVTLLDPIAYGQVNAADVKRGLRSRREVT